MITYLEILNAVTRKIRENFKGESIFVDDIEQGFEEPCFCVSIMPITGEVITRNLNSKSLIISIKYFNDDIRKIDLLDKLNSLEKIFFRSLNVKDRVLTFKNIESDILEDAKGKFLNFLITVNFVDGIEEEVNYKKARDIKIGGV